jgi:hypothetical protein
MRNNIMTKLVKYITAIVNTYPSLLRDETRSMLVVPEGLKQGGIEDVCPSSRCLTITIC